MKNRILLFFYSLTFLLAGCMSEVDKCVDAQVKSWKTTKSKTEEEVRLGNKKYAISNEQWTYGKLFDSSIVFRDERTLEEVEAQSRLQCLKVAGKS